MPSITIDGAYGSASRHISSRWAAALTGSHIAVARGQLLSGATVLASFPIDSGSLTVDRNNLIRRTIQLQLSEGCLTNPDGSPLLDSGGTLVAVTPRLATDLFTPYGNEIVVQRGIVFSNGDQEWVQDGVFGIDSLLIEDSGQDLQITLNGSDRSRAIQRVGFTSEGQLAGGLISSAIQNLVQVILAGQGFTAWQNWPPFNLAATSFTMPSAPVPFKPGDDAWQLITDPAEAAACELLLDTTGALSLQAVPDPTTQPLAWSYDEGQLNLAVGLRRTLSRDKAPNIIIRDGSGSGLAAPVRGIAMDTNPASPTRVSGPYGPVTEGGYQASSLYTTQAQAQAVAEADLRKSLGSIESLDLIAYPKPDHDVDDVIEVSRSRAGLASSYYVIDAFTLDYSGRSHTLTCREVYGWAGAS